MFRQEAQMKLLYAEDEKSMSEAVKDILEFHKYNVDVVENGQDALTFAQHGDYDGIILDIMMPGLDGLQVLTTLRQTGNFTPILLLTAKGDTEDRIKGLDLGADDYLTKPFNMGELLARVRAMLRRREVFVPDVLEVGNLRLNLSTYELESGNECLVLSKVEFQLMELLMMNKGIFLSTEDLLTKVWGYDAETEIGIVWVYLSNLRKRLAKLQANVEIKAKRNIGYTLEVRS
jgi:DNA-binding response OmpR family regulator